MGSVCREAAEGLASGEAAGPVTKGAKETLGTVRAEGLQEAGGILC